MKHKVVERLDFIRGPGVLPHKNHKLIRSWAKFGVLILLNGMVVIDYSERRTQASDL